ncbi:phytanoyl-CoA dioxygenase family protein [Streptacidiphilus sp. PB12-B1b]|uniref:phytanoyl-CoA dioxygenase family protein n=1 Tax=Streptacidiphilus sp. PB12-B1b TaxID=2705012 RepID=UPI0015FAB357|nr:phytanoyl-CoA dioxygenase family protein [Streptacidiphilus sp. PB12-B1b]QMU78275.1 phytanoyl-CoA dioxygenase family protein [Streptacidiphilus sp. PB12-B1b]
MDGIVRVDPGEGARGAVPPDAGAVAAAVAAMRDDGAVILEGVVDRALLERLRSRMLDDLDILLRRPDRAENFAPGHLQQDPPAETGYLWPDVLAHPFVLEVCRRTLQQPVRLSSYSNNSNLPGSEPQPVHVDEGQRWPGLPRAHPAARLIVNIPLRNTDTAGGAIELWPGTHLDPRMCQHAGSPSGGVDQALRYLRAAKRAGAGSTVNRRVGLTVPEAMTGERRTERPPVRAVTEAGSVIIRDSRLWHRGMPNASDCCRFMLALTYDPLWRFPGDAVELPAAAAPLFESAGLEVWADFVDGPIDHLGRHSLAASSPLRRLRSTGSPT